MGFESRLALYFAATFAAIGVQMPFLPVWFAARGLDERTIGLMLAVSALTRVVAVPVAALGTDRLGALKGSLVTASFVAAAAMAALGVAGNVTAMVLSFAVASAALSITIPLTDAYAMQGLTARGRTYGPVRLWGSVAFIAGNLGAGVLADAIAPGALIWPMAATFCVAALVAIALLPTASGAPPPIEHRRSAVTLLRMPACVMVVLASSLVQGSHAVYYGFSSLDWAAAGLGGVTVGTLWSIGVAAEIALFAASGRFPAAIGPTVLLLLGAAGAVLRWSVMALAPSAALLPALQCLHALSFGATHLGAVQYLARAAPPGLAATALGLLAVAGGVVMTIAMAMSGVVHGRFGPGAYGAMAAMAAAGGVAALLAHWFWREPPRTPGG
jgi:MFS transporter, PPP family, 3-phenylpropionic acid transporter